MPDQITGVINHIRLMADAILSGRIEAKTVKEMTDEQLTDYIARLQLEARAEVEEGFRMHDPAPENP